MRNVNALGGKLLRELTRSLKLVRPDVMLIAEDHSDDLSYAVRPTEEGGLGFDAVWYADFYHHLIGDTNHSNKARLLKEAGYGDNRWLDIDAFAGTIARSGHRRVVYHESHDEAGNGGGTERTMVTAVNGVVSSTTRPYAESRSRLVAGLSILSAGTPMFLFGEEVGTVKSFLYDRVLEHREDLIALRAGNGERLFRYYAALNRLRCAHEGLRSRDITIVYVHNDNRILAFRRRHGDEEFLVVGSFNNLAFASGYEMTGIDLPGTRWREVFNSDAASFGGQNVGNGGATIPVVGRTFRAALPARGLIVFQKT
jgi:1,4-alpha-glucan branching enzyme